MSSSASVLYYHARGGVSHDQRLHENLTAAQTRHVSVNRQRPTSGISRTWKERQDAIIVKLSCVMVLFFRLYYICGPGEQEQLGDHLLSVAKSDVVDV
jgi:hypothetical protein